LKIILFVVIITCTTLWYLKGTEEDIDLEWTQT